MYTLILCTTCLLIQEEENGDDGYDDYEDDFEVNWQLFPINYFVLINYVHESL